MSGIEGGSGGWTVVAYGAIIVFLLLVAVVIARSLALYLVLLLLPVGRLLRWIPGVSGALRRLERTATRESRP